MQSPEKNNDRIIGALTLLLLPLLVPVYAWLLIALWSHVAAAWSALKVLLGAF